MAECRFIELLNEQGYVGIQVCSICVPAGSINFLPIVCPSLASTTLPSVILELLEDGSCLPPGLLVLKTLLKVTKVVLTSTLGEWV